MSRSNIAIFTGSKGRGSNMTALIKATQNPEFPAEIAVVVTPKPNTQAEEAATTLNTPVITLDPKSETYAEEIESLIKEHNIKFICLAGYTTLFPKEVITKHPLQVLNIHPALLPSYGGKGMYGRYVHEAVIASNDEQSGCTVHYVSERYDEGHIILQRTCAVLKTDTPETLAARVLEQEHLAYPEAIFNLLTAK
ncbi:MAG: phosphoribosylglycinamide formyltransferase [Fimbriimonadaceae bacterium]